jgi:urea transport system permease protein
MFKPSILLFLLITFLLPTVLSADINVEILGDNLTLEKAIAELNQKSRKKLIKGIKQLGKLNNVQALPALHALLEKKLGFDSEENALIIQAEDRYIDAIQLTPKQAQGKFKKLRVNNSVRRALSPVIAILQLQSDNIDIRLNAALTLTKKSSSLQVQQLKDFIQQEPEQSIKEVLTLILAKLQINATDTEQRLKAIEIMKKSGSIKFVSLLNEVLEKDEQGQFIEDNKSIIKAAQTALIAIEHKQFLINQTANLFYGLSLGSILLLAALGLAITFGLLGVINMAHGEMLMLGAYSTYVVQGLFQQYIPQLFDFYLLIAIPFAFMISAGVGIVMERTVIRHLYGRPLETLLATWGISLLLIQTIRLIFGAQNVAVVNPSWLAGGVQVMEGVVLPYNRISIIIFSITVVIAVWALLQKTSLGLKVRAVTQNRPMASSLGISTSKVDMLTFGIGSGVAGLGGVALSQIGNVGPELGQSYIVDSFMVVVLGGVGKIAGTVAGAFGLGIINKFLEPSVGAVLGKIMVLVFIILFIQKRPQGIFALKGRMAEN